MVDKDDSSAAVSETRELFDLKEKIKQGTEVLIKSETPDDVQKAQIEYLNALIEDINQKKRTRIRIGLAVIILASLYILYVPSIYLVHFIWPSKLIDNDIIIALIKTIPWAIGLMGVVVIFYHPSKTLDKVLEKLPGGK